MEALAANRYLTIPNGFTLFRLCCIPLFLYLLFGRDNRRRRGVAAWWPRRHRLGRRLAGASLATRSASSERSSTPPPIVCSSSSGIGGIIIDGAAPLWIAWAVVIREVVFGGTVAVATLAFGMKRFDVTWLGKTATFLLMFAFPGFMLGSTDFPGHQGFLVAAWILGVPGLILSYYTAVDVHPDIRESLREGREAAR